MSLECGNDYEMKVVPHDLNVWLSRMYLGDADGFSIMYYSDVDSIVYWANEAAYTYGVSGIAIWSLGQEDMRLWEQYARSDIVLESNSLLRAVFFIPKNKERQVTVMRQAVTTVQYVFAGIGGFMGWFLGGLDGFLYALLMFVVIDYVTGLMAAFVQKKVSSEVGFKGICKKVAIFCLVGIGHVLDTQVIQNGSVLRTAVIFFYLSNEGISIIENVALIGLPVPKKLKEVLEQLHEEADEKKEDE